MSGPVVWMLMPTPSSLYLSFVCTGVGASVPCLFTLGAELFPVHSRGIHLSYIASFWMVRAVFKITYT